MTDQVLAESVKRAPITKIDVPAVSDPAASTVTASYTVGKTPVTVDYGGAAGRRGVEADARSHKTVDLGLVRTPSIPIRINGVKVTSDFVDVLPGTYAFTTESPQLTLGSKAVMVVKHPNDYANVLDLRVGLSDAGRKTVVGLARKSYNACLRSRITRPRNCPFAWTNSGQRYRQSSVTLASARGRPVPQAQRRGDRALGPRRHPAPGAHLRALHLQRRLGTCSGNVTGRGVASIRLDKAG